jgi:hypothetical protein
MSAAEILNREFLTVRCRLIEVAAALDRIGRADGSVDDVRLENLRRSLEVLGQPGTDRVERIQQIFSLPYAPDWREQWGGGKNV